MKRSGKQYWRVVITALALVLGMMMPTRPPPVLAQGNQGNPGVLPPNSHAFGETYGEWSAAWWQWVLSIPEATNPNLDPTGADCAEGQSGKVWFLAGTFGGSATRTCTVPQGKAIFFPVLNTANGAGAFDCEPTVPGVPCEVATLRALAAAAEDDPMLLQVEIDGNPLQNLSAYRVQSPVFSITYPVGGLFGLSGTFTPNVSDGYWLLLAPLSTGTHTIHSTGIANNGFGSEVTYYLTIGH